jgi:thiamine biosynthesis protein ThiS
MTPWADMEDLITVTVDGFADLVPKGTSIAELIQRHQAQHKDLLVELGGSFVAPAYYERTLLNDGDRIELIHPAFGG